MTDQPDILLLMADQLAPHFLPVYGHPVVLAPNLSELARGGAVFDAAYCNSPLCAPSRFSMMTGRMPSDIGAYDNASPLSPALPTFAHHLRRGGYRTALAGKMHFVGPDQLHGFEERLTTDIYPADFGWTPNWDDPGSDPVRAYLRQAARDIAEAGPAPRPTLQMRYDDETTHRAVRWLQAEDRGGRPFLLTVSYTHPHDPFTITREYWDRYEGRAVDDPTTPAPEGGPADEPSRRLWEAFGFDGLELTPGQVRAARRAYYGGISYLDDGVGRVLSAFRERSGGRPALIVFASDHGEMLGERGMWFKMGFFERSARIPLIAAGAGAPPGRVRTPVSLIDLLPTLVEAAGLGPDGAETPGRSLLPAARREPEPARPPVLGEFLGEGVTDPVVMIREGSYKYISMLGAAAQLFDLASDPEEQTDLIGAGAGGSAAAAAERMSALAEERWDLGALRAEIAADQKQRRMVHQALTAGRRTHWDYSPPDESASSYIRNA